MKGRNKILNTARLLLLPGFFCLSVIVNAQADKKYIRKGNKQYEKGSYSESEILYRKANDKNIDSPEATFNIGDALYKQKKYEDAGKQFIQNSSQVSEPEKKASSLYNLGNSLLEANKVQESIEAYKNALKIDPSNKEAKYNLGYAQNLLKQQQQQQQQQKQQQQNNQKNQDKNQQQKNDKDNQNKNDQQQDKDQEKDQQQQQQQQNQQAGMSKEDAERLLNALANDEKNVQEKVKREKAAQSRSRTLKNW
jgi:tetratricopeptide (TPR) repeat protein